MGIPTLITTLTASGDSSLADTSSMTSTYDEYMFVFTDIGPATDNVTFHFQVNASGESGYNETMTTSYFVAYHDEGDSSTALAYTGSQDQAQGTAYQPINNGLSNDADHAVNGVLHIFNPSSTTYVTNFYSRSSGNDKDNFEIDAFMAGYVNATAAIDEISFKMSSGNFDGVIQIYGIS